MLHLKITYLPLTNCNNYKREIFLEGRLTSQQNSALNEVCAVPPEYAVLLCRTLITKHLKTTVWLIRGLFKDRNVYSMILICCLFMSFY